MSGGMTLYVLYKHPLDYPGHWVIRPQHVGGGVVVPDGGAVIDEDGARLQAWFEERNPDLTWIERDPNDEPQIVGSWI